MAGRGRCERLLVRCPALGEVETDDADLAFARRGPGVAFEPATAQRAVVQWVVVLVDFADVEQAIAVLVGAAGIEPRVVGSGGHRGGRYAVARRP